MNSKRLTQGVLLSFVFILILGSIALGTHWFFKNLGDFFEWKTSKDKSAFLASVSDSAEAELADDNIKTQSPYRDWRIKDIEVLAQSALSVESNIFDLPSQILSDKTWEGEDKTLFKKDEDKKLPIASLTKLMTAMVVLENYNLAETITISKKAVLQEGSQGALKQDDAVSVKDLLYIMLIESSNQAAYALSEGLPSQILSDKTWEGEEEKNFVELMNDKAKELGLGNTHFSDSIGLSLENYSTSEDLIKLTKHLLKNYPIITEISRTKEIDLYKQDASFYAKLVNTNELLGEIPDIVGGKTGFTTNAKGCLILVLNNHRNENYLIFVILGADDRFGEMKKLIDWVNTAYIWR